MVRAETVQPKKPNSIENPVKNPQLIAQNPVEFQKVVQEPQPVDKPNQVHRSQTYDIDAVQRERQQRLKDVCSKYKNSM